MEHDNSPDTPLGRGCKNMAAILASIVLLFFAALLTLGYIEITDMVTVAENTGVNP